MGYVCAISTYGMIYTDLNFLAISGVTDNDSVTQTSHIDTTEWTSSSSSSQLHSTLPITLPESSGGVASGQVEYIYPWSLLLLHSLEKDTHDYIQTS